MNTKAINYPFAVITIILAATGSISGISILKASSESANNIDCLIDFIKSSIKFKDLVVYDHSNSRGTYNNVLTKFMQRDAHNKNLILETITPGHQCVNKNTFYKQFLVFINTAKELNDIIKSCLIEQLHPNSPFLLIVTEDKKQTTGILEVLKYHRIYLSPLITAYNETELLISAVKSNCKDNPDIDSELYSCGNSVLRSKFHLLDHVRCKFKVGVRITPPYVFKLKAEQMYGFREEYQGTELFTLRHLMDYLNHSIKYISYNSSIIGHYNDETKEGSGLIKELVEGKVDIIVGKITLSNYSKFIEPFYMSAHDIKIAVVKKTKRKPIYENIKYIFLGIYGIYVCYLSWS